MRCFFVGVSTLVLGVAAFPALAADDKPAAAVDGKKLVAKWEGGAILIKDSKSLIEFAADGTIKVKTTKKTTTGSIGFSNEGKYTLDGNKLTIITKLPDGKEDKSVAIITKLTDEELEWRNSAERVEAFKRVKEEKK